MQLPRRQRSPAISLEAITVADTRYICAAPVLLNVAVFGMLDKESAGREVSAMLRAPLVLFMPVAAMAVVGLPLLKGLRSGQPARPTITTLSNSEAGALPVAEHPLWPVLDLARQTQQYVSNNVRDYQCTLIKRERIDGDLQAQRVIEMRVREGSPQAGFPRQ